MNSAEPGTAMPELARTIIHKEGVKLIIDWINHMPKRQEISLAYGVTIHEKRIRRSTGR